MGKAMPWILAAIVAGGGYYYFLQRRRMIASLEQAATPEARAREAARIAAAHERAAERAKTQGIAPTLVPVWPSFTSSTYL